MLSFIKDIDLGFKLPLPDKTIKVAVTGLSRSGKTVFMTSFINQLLANDKLTYLNEKINTKFVAKLLPPDTHYARFDYFSKLKAFRQKDPKWPEATKQVSKTTIQLKLKSEYNFFDNQIINIELIDYPGEWLLDLSMLELTFDEWSKQTISLAKMDDKKEYSYEYFRILDEYDIYSKSDGSDDEIIFDAYCEYLKCLYYNHFSFMQPGRFLEPGDLDGDPILHFAPLPYPKDGVVIDDESIYMRFQNRYKRYLDEVVQRLYLEHFKYFDTQIVLVDLIKTLEYGYDSFKDMNLAFKHILKSFTYGSNSFLSRLFGLKIEHVIFAATKADFIPRVQHNSYKNVLNRLIGKIRDELDVSHTQTQTTIFSAVKSTRYVKAKYNGEILECIEGVVEGEDEVSIHYPGALPDDFESESFWIENKFEFPNFKPRVFPHSDAHAVEHIRMDRLIYSILRKVL